MRYPSPSKITQSTSISLSFHPTSLTGLILYVGDVTQVRDFLSLSLVNGRVELRYDLGSGPAIIMSTTTVSLNEWHTLTATRTGRVGLLSVDDLGTYTGVSPATTTILDAKGDLFIGGSADYSKVSNNAGSETGFSGCIDTDNIQVNFISL